MTFTDKWISSQSNNSLNQSEAKNQSHRHDPTFKFFTVSLCRGRRACGSIDLGIFFFYYYNTELFKKQISNSDPKFKEGNAPSPKSEYTFEYTTKVS